MLHDTVSRIFARVDIPMHYRMRTVHTGFGWIQAVSN